MPGMFVKTTRRRRGRQRCTGTCLWWSLSATARRLSPDPSAPGGRTALRESGQFERIVATLERHLHRERVDVGALAAEGDKATIT